MKKPCHYLVVDDDTTSNLICEFNIRRFQGDANITVFTNPDKALQFIEAQKFPDDCEIIMLLDINMPIMTGFEFLIEFEKFRAEIKCKFQIYILTSSIENFSVQASNFPRVKGFLSKPLQQSYLKKIQIDHGYQINILS